MPPLGPPQDGRQRGSDQGSIGYRPRQRACLLKGCEQPFHPRCPQQRYCSDACRYEARRWRRWHAQRRYRATENGKQRRRSQSCRYRRRVREGKLTSRDTADGPREGQRPAEFSKKIPCRRPGCYELFDSHPRTPCRKFCCSLCRRALWRVIERETRWQRRRLSEPSSPSPHNHPPWSS